MNLADIKTYLSTRINASDILSLSDAELTKYMSTASNLLNVFYKMEDLTDDSKLALVTGEEMLFLFNSNIDLNLFYQYEGLTSFDVGGAIKGSVDYKNVGDLFSQYVKAFLESEGIEEKIDSPNKKVKHRFTWL